MVREVAFCVFAESFISSLLIAAYPSIDNRTACDLITPELHLHVFPYPYFHPSIQLFYINLNIININININQPQRNRLTFPILSPLSFSKYCPIGARATAPHGTAAINQTNTRPIRQQSCHVTAKKQTFCRDLPSS